MTETEAPAAAPAEASPEAKLVALQAEYEKARKANQELTQGYQRLAARAGVLSQEAHTLKQTVLGQSMVIAELNTALKGAQPG